MARIIRRSFDWNLTPIGGSAVGSIRAKLNA
jgi:hypothetical protein